MDPSQLVSVVDTERLRRVFEIDGADRLAGGRGVAEGVGEVELPLGVAGVEAAQERENRRRGQGVNSGVDPPDGELFKPGVGGLDDALELAGGAGQHPPERPGLLELGHRHRSPAVVGRRRQPIEGRRRHHGDVAGEHQQDGVTVDVRLGLRQGVTGAELLPLLDPGDVVTGDRRLNFLGTVPDDHQDLSAATASRGLDHPFEHRPSPDRMQDFGQGRTHAFALAGGQYHRDAFPRAT